MKLSIFFVILILMATMVFAAPKPYGINYYKEGLYGLGIDIPSSSSEAQSTIKSASEDDNPAHKASDTSTVKGNNLPQGGCVTGCGDGEKAKSGVESSVSQEVQVKPKSAPLEEEERVASPLEEEIKEEIPTPVLEETSSSFGPGFFLPLLFVMALPLLLLIKKRKKEKEASAKKEKILSQLKKHKL